MDFVYAVMMAPHPAVLLRLVNLAGISWSNRAGQSVKAVEMEAVLRIYCDEKSTKPSSPTLSPSPGQQMEYDVATRRAALKARDVRGYRPQRNRNAQLASQ